MQTMYRKFLFPGSLENGADVTFLQQQGMIFFMEQAFLLLKNYWKLFIIVYSSHVLN